jgi:hypothetical protein
MTRSLLAVVFLLLMVTGAKASQQGVIVLQNWKAMDLCTKQAQAAFPDFTADANAKRDAQLKACLESRNLPPRQPQSPGN